MNTVICEPAGGDFEFSTATVWFEFSLLKNLNSENIHTLSPSLINTQTQSKIK